MGKLGVGIVGPGWAGGEHIKAYMNNPNVEIVALCGRDEGRTKARSEEHDLECGIYTDYEEMLKRDDIHIVSICTPNNLHVSQGVAAAQAGKHILMEKPMALNVDVLNRIFLMNRSGCLIICLSPSLVRNLSRSSGVLSISLSLSSGGTIGAGPS